MLRLQSTNMSPKCEITVLPTSVDILQRENFFQPSFLKNSMKACPKRAFSPCSSLSKFYAAQLDQELLATIEERQGLLISAHTCSQVIATTVQLEHSWCKVDIELGAEKRNEMFCC